MTRSEILKKKCRKIKLLISDVDGILTDGGMYYSEKGEVLKKFNTRDGMGIELLSKKGVKTILMTKENSNIVKSRAKKIKAAATYLGIYTKEKHLTKICKKFSVNNEQIAYIGDDINDLELLKRVGLSVTPSDASDNAIKLCDYICKHRSGNGAFRELADLILFTQNNKRKKTL